MNHVIWYPGYDLMVTNIVRAQNCYLYDTQGKQYLDLEAGVWCISIGHGHKRLIRTIAEQSKNIMSQVLITLVK
ncbi:MAG: aminotransferase class III-fold pyridoxal phosphate-dependent enzyme [bacterium]